MAERLHAANLPDAAPPRCELVGRVLSETLPNGAVPAFTSRVVKSDPAANGLVTVIDMQMVGTTRYFDAAGFPGRTVGLSPMGPASATQ
jgi:hypothetical protein